MAEPISEEHKQPEIDEVQLFEIDKSVYNWFNVEKSLTVQNRKIPVIFGSWERFAQMQDSTNDDNLNPIRDKSGMLKLPIISLKRESIEPNLDRYKSVDKEGYPFVTFSRKIGRSAFDMNRRIPFNPKFQVGNTSYYKKEHPPYEVCYIPYPTFLNISFNVSFWSSFVRHANTFNNMIWSEIFPKNIKHKNYWFFSRFESSSDDSNAEEFSQEERIIRNSFTLTIEAFLLKKENARVFREPSRIDFSGEKIIEADDIFTVGG